MKSLKLIFSFLSVLIIFTSSIFAETGTATGIPNRIYVYGDGRVLVTGFHFTNASNCSNNGSLYIRGDHAHLGRLLSVIILAKTTGKKLVVTADVSKGCWYPQILSSSGTYIYLEN